MDLFSHRSLDPDKAEHRALWRIEHKLDAIAEKLEIEMTDINSIEADEAGLASDEAARDTATTQAFADLEAAVKAASSLSPADAAALDAPLQALRTAVQGGTAAATAADATTQPAPAPAPGA